MTASTHALPDRSIPPASLPVRNLMVTQAEIGNLNNGMPVYSVNAGFQDLIRVEFLFENRRFRPELAALTAAANRLLSEGTTRHSALQLAEMIDDVGAFLETEESADNCSVVLYTLNKHLASTLPIVKEMLTLAVFPESEVGVYRKKQQQRLAVENERVNSIARRKFNQLLFGSSNPYGYMVESTDFDRLDTAILQEYHRSQYHSGNCVLLLAGKIHDSTLPLLNQHFGGNDWQQPAPSQPVFGEIVSDASKIQFLHKEGALQSAIRIGRRMMTRAHEDYPGLSVLNTVLGGYFGSRLMSNIREDKGYTYGIGSALVSLKREGYFFISTEVGADVTSAALAEIYKEIEILQHELVPKEELYMVRNYMLGSFLKGIDGPFALLDRFKTLQLSGLDYSYFERYLLKLETIGSEEIRDLARKYFKKEDLYELVVGVK